MDPKRNYSQLSQTPKQSISTQSPSSHPPHSTAIPATQPSSPSEDSLESGQYFDPEAASSPSTPVESHTFSWSQKNALSSSQQTTTAPQFYAPRPIYPQKHTPLLNSPQLVGSLTRDSPPLGPEWSQPGPTPSPQSYWYQTRNRPSPFMRPGNPLPVQDSSPPQSFWPPTRYSPSTS
ncbi:hypothetical protein GGI08_001362 [Coemansia sp. S2]|nr:hypothetical protein GGI08_001362 [Coemansia sp. S2]